ncbi:efflux RND transporter periplasmic adaptor subunit [Clostridium magnum]|nr:hypothetical protein [Clostridium magnum]
MDNLNSLLGEGMVANSAVLKLDNRNYENEVKSKLRDMAAVNSVESKTDALNAPLKNMGATKSSIGVMIIKGKITKIAPEAKNITSSLGVNQKRVPVTIELNDTAGLLKPGYDLDIKVITEVKKNTLIIPDTSVFDYKGNSCVFVVDNGKAVIKQIKKGIESEKLIEVIGGLKSGEKVLLKPDNNIKDGMKINSK